MSLDRSADTDSPRQSSPAYGLPVAYSARQQPSAMVFYLRSWKIATIGLMFVLFGAMGASLTFDTGAPRWNVFAAAVCSLGAALLGGLGLALLVRAASPRPAIRTDGNGIEFRSVPFLSGHVPFTNVCQVRTVSYGMANYVALCLKDDEQFLLSQPGFLRPALRYLAQAGHPVCVILVGAGKSRGPRVIAGRLRAIVRASQGPDARK